MWRGLLRQQRVAHGAFGSGLPQRRLRARVRWIQCRLMPDRYMSQNCGHSPEEKSRDIWRTAPSPMHDSYRRDSAVQPKALHQVLNARVKMNRTEPDDPGWRINLRGHPKSSPPSPQPDQAPKQRVYPTWVAEDINSTPAVLAPTW